MSDEEIKRIERQIESLTEAVNGFRESIGERMMRQETLMFSLQSQVGRMDERLSEVAQNGCAHYPEHTEVKVGVRELDKRLVTLEADKRVALGVVGTISAVVGGLVSWIGWLIGK